MNKRRFSLSGAIGTLIGLCCALVLGALFYGAMAYQLAGEAQPQAAAVQASGALLALPGMELLSQETTTRRSGGVDCTVTTRRYEAEGTADAIRADTATSVALMEQIAEAGFEPQLITGFTLAGLDAVYYTRGAEALLCARSGDTLYLLSAIADEQTMYALGTAAAIE